MSPNEFAVFRLRTNSNLLVVRSQVCKPWFLADLGTHDAQLRYRSKRLGPYARRPPTRAKSGKSVTAATR